MVTFVITASAAIPTALSGAMVHLKELASDWGNKNNHSFFSKRSAIDYKKKYFGADAPARVTVIFCPGPSFLMPRNIVSGAKRELNERKS